MRSSTAFLMILTGSAEAFRFVSSKNRPKNAPVSPLCMASESSEDVSPSSSFHIVRGVRCREVTNELPIIGTVRVLEATADSQEELMDECLHLPTLFQDDDDDDDDEFDDDDYDYDYDEKIPRRMIRGDPYGVVQWPASWAVAQYILSSDISLPSTTVLELGAGTGLVSLAAALGGARAVLATDYEPLALELTRYARDRFCPSIDTTLDTRVVDVCDLRDPLPLENKDRGSLLVVAADVLYDPQTATAMAYRVVEALQHTTEARVIVGDSPGRPGRPAFLQTLWELGVDKSVNFAEMATTTDNNNNNSSNNTTASGPGDGSASPTPEEQSVAILDLQPSMLTMAKTG